MQLVQFFLPEVGRRVGVIQGAEVVDLTSVESRCQSLSDLVQQAFQTGQRLTAVVASFLDRPGLDRLSYAELWQADPHGDQPHLLPPLDHPEPSRLLISGTGLTHLGSVQSRDQMHGGTEAVVPQTDSARMFALGIAGGKPASGQRGTAPEWFYKGNGHNVRGHRSTLEIPAFARDGGEEPEIVGCYAIDPHGQPRRIGFALGNEWSDHATEKINYLYLAPSKLRVCSLGPSIQITDDFADIPLRCTVTRKGRLLYDSGELRSGEQHMCHSLGNLEDHHFKFAQHRQPGDIHLHFFGTSKLSYGTRDWVYESGDEIQISAPGFCEPLINTVSAGPTTDGEPIRVRSL